MAKKKATPRKKKASPRSSSAARSSGNTLALKPFWEEKSPILRFFLLWAVMMIAFYLLWSTDFFKDNILHYWNNVNAWIASGILAIFGQGTSAVGTIISSDNASVNIKEGCDAIEPTVLFITGVLAFPGLKKFKLKGILWGAVFLLGVNMIRILSLYLTRRFWPDAFEFMHIEFWQTLYILLALGAWGFWLIRSLKKEQTHEGASTAST